LAGYLKLVIDEDRLDLLDILSRYYLTTRYPVVKQKLSKSIDKKESFELLKKTRDFIKWLKKESKI